MDVPKTSGLALWLLPGPEHSRKLNSLISELSQRYQTPAFIPHITLGRVPHVGRQVLFASLENLVKKLSQLQVEVFQLKCTESSFQKVILPLNDEVMSVEFKNKVDEHFGGEYAKPSGYHISLMYGNVPCKQVALNKIRANVRILNKVHIQSLALVDLNFTPEHWKVIFEAKL